MRLYLSSYQWGDRPDLFAAMAAANTRGFVIMNAVDGADDSLRASATERQIDGLASLGLHATSLDLRELSPTMLTGELDDTGFFWVHGGNVFTLRMAMYNSGFDRFVVDGLSDDRFVYAGFSAGACVLAPSLRGLELCDPITDCEEIYGRAIVEGLDVLDRPFVPHLDSSHHAEAETMARVAHHYAAMGIEYWGLRDGQALVIDGDSLEVV